MSRFTWLFVLGLALLTGTPTEPSAAASSRCRRNRVQRPLPPPPQPCRPYRWRERDPAPPVPFDIWELRNRRGRATHEVRDSTVIAYNHQTSLNSWTTRVVHPSNYTGGVSFDCPSTPGTSNDGYWFAAGNSTPANLRGPLAYNVANDMCRAWWPGFYSPSTADDVCKITFSVTLHDGASSYSRTWCLHNATAPTAGACTPPGLGCGSQVRYQSGTLTWEPDPADTSGVRGRLRVQVVYVPSPGSAPVTSPPYYIPTPF